MTWRHFIDRTTKTHTEHTCYLCDQVIRSFTQAVRRRGSMNGKPMSFMMHVDCEYVSKSWDDLDWLTNDPVQFAAYMADCRSSHK